MTMIYKVVFNDRTDIITKENPRNLCYDSSIFVDCHKMEYGEYLVKTDTVKGFTKMLGWKEYDIVSINVRQILYIESKDLPVVE